MKIKSKKYTKINNAKRKSSYTVRYSSLALQSFCFHVQIEHSTRMSHCR